MRQPAFVALLLTIAAWPVPAADRHAAPAADAGSELIARFMTRRDEPLVSYTATRQLEASNDRFKAAGRMTVRVTLKDGAFDWDVLEESGSAYVRNAVLRKALEGERDTIASGAAQRAELNAENYDIRFGGADGPGLARLTLVPLRKDMLLVHGLVLVTDPEADLLEVSGRLAKNPSWWTTSVDVVRSYARIAGVRVPVRMESVARVRIAGRSRFAMTSEYETVNERPVSPRPSRTDGTAPAGRPSVHSRPTSK
jgi:hypothetical protein